MELLARDKVKVSFDERTGYVTEIINPADKHQMNWVLPDSAWGKVDGFSVQNVEIRDNGIVVDAIGNAIDSRGLSLKIERVLTNAGYCESYTFENQTQTDFFANQETFGLHFPFRHLFDAKQPLDEQIPQNCVAHVWCGYNTCWICGKKVDGSGEKLFINMTSGDICDYSIDRDISQAKGCDSRGSIVLNPTPFVLAKSEKKTFAFAYTFTSEKLEDILSKQENFINAYATTCTGFLGETIGFAAEYRNGIESAKVINNGKEVDIKIEATKIEWSTTGEIIGEQRFDIYINDAHTIVLVNFIENLSTILEKRAYFIAEKQQYLKEGSHLDGAYLIYDDTTKSQFYSNSFLDRNAGRERIAMGVVVLRQLQKKKDAFLMKSIKKHLEFVEREHFDIESGTAFNHILKNNNWDRAFNYPWFSVYFKEWYVLTGDPEYLRRSALCLIDYYRVTNYEYDGQLAEIYPVIKMLEKEKMNELAEQIRSHILKTADTYSDRHFGTVGNECSFVQECPNNRCVYAAQAYLLCKNEKYLAEAKKQKVISEAFFACQPDYHLNGISVRNWDRFWFGKKRQYGDLYPHYWSALMGWMYGWYEKASGEDHKHIREEILKNNLCVYRTDGFAYNNYLYPYKINMYSSSADHNDKYRPTGSYYGKCYDEWANDQDWALYLADYFLNSNFVFAE